MHAAPDHNDGPLVPIEDDGVLAAAFLVVEGRLSNNRVQVSQTLATLGSDPSCDIWLPYPEIRPLHAIMARRSIGWWIRGLDDSFPIAINGKTVRSASLTQGDRLGVGRLILEFNDGFCPDNIKTDITAHHRLYAAILAAQHMEAMEQRRALEFKEHRLLRRTRRIASRLKGLAECPPQGTGKSNPPDSIPQKVDPWKHQAEKIELEKARLARLRTRLLIRWKNLRKKPVLPLDAVAGKNQNSDDSSKSFDGSQRLKLHRPDPQPSTQESSVPSLGNEISLLQQRRSDLLLEIEGLARKAERMRAEMRPREVVLPLSQAEGVLHAANLMARHHAEWDQDATATIKALEEETVALAQREHQIAEREALLETLLGQRHRQREELDLSIHGAARETRLATIRAKESEIEANRLRRELEQLNEAWDRRTAAPANSTSNLPQAWLDLYARLDRLINKLGKAVDWACQDLNESERAELEYLRFNSILHGLPPSDPTLYDIRSVVESVSEEIRDCLIPKVDEFLRANELACESPDRRLVIEAHRWKIRSENLEKALMETRALLQEKDVLEAKDWPNRAA